jgi:D-aminoacyl-tRNA deacylase
MKALVQYVTKASIASPQVKNSINRGYVILVGIHVQDTSSTVLKLAHQILTLRIIPDSQGKLNRSIMDIQGDILLIPQFTLQGNLESGHRPTYHQAARPQTAIPLWKNLIAELKKSNLTLITGEFGSHMDITLTNSGPITLMLDT